MPIFLFQILDFFDFSFIDNITIPTAIAIIPINILRVIISLKNSEKIDCKMLSLFII